MTERFDILCNNCGQEGISFRPFQEVATCPSCQTRLKIEETETTIETIVIDEKEFLTMNPTPIPVYQNETQEKLLQLQTYEKQLRELEANWKKNIEKFKFEGDEKHILSQRNRSSGLLLLGLLIFLYSILIDKKERTYLTTIGLVWLFLGAQGFFHWMNYTKKSHDFEKEKERLEMKIWLINSDNNQTTEFSEQTINNEGAND
ncbi:MAG: hypothetical protein ACJAUH_002700 [Saprospiraceae bacterium]|jgi:hypothetical protein